MNKHILLIMRWLDNPASVTLRELKHFEHPRGGDGRLYSSYDADAYAITAGDAAIAGSWVITEKWIAQYFELSGDNRDEYADTVKRLNAHLIPPPKIYVLNLASRIARLDGLLVIDECTGFTYCEASYPFSSVKRKYDPVNNAGILLALIEKYPVNLEWCEGAYIVNVGEVFLSTRSYKGCLATTILTAILEAN